MSLQGSPQMWSASNGSDTADWYPPVFVGGTGRSGTTIVARVLGSHPESHMIPIEVRFLVDPNGLCDLVAGETGFGRFSRLLLGPWWQRTLRDGTTRGLHLILEKSVLMDALDELGEGPKVDVAAARRFVGRIFDPLAAAAAATRWIEMTPPNVLRGRQLLAMFPDMKLINTIRDGRDVASSVAVRDWGPSDVMSALTWWEERMLQAHQACYGMSSANFLTIQLEDLVVRDPVGTLSTLIDFVGVNPDPAVEAFMKRYVRAERSHIGRWQIEVEPSMVGAFEANYQRVIRRLVEDGVDVPTQGPH